MTPQKKIPYFTKLDRELREAMRRYKEDVGVPESVQIDKALREWLAERIQIAAAPAMEKKGSTKKPERKRR